jgi:hypothetical protein
MYNAHGAFTPAAWLPPDVITLKRRLYNTIAQPGSGQGDGHGPFLYFLCLISYSHTMDSPEQKIQERVFLIRIRTPQTTTYTR